MWPHSHLHGALNTKMNMLASGSGRRFGCMFGCGFGRGFGRGFGCRFGGWFGWRFGYGFGGGLGGTLGSMTDSTLGNSFSSTSTLRDHHVFPDPGLQRRTCGHVASGLHVTDMDQDCLAQLNMQDNARQQEVNDAKTV